MDSPRGRIFLIKALADGRLDYSQDVIEHFDLCLNCRNCETACPSGVKFGYLMETTRAQVERIYRRNPIRRFGRWIVFNQFFANPSRMASAFKLLRFYQKSSLGRFLRNTGLTRLLPERLRRTEDMLLALPDKFFEPRECEITEPEGEQKHLVGFLAGCIMRLAFADINRACLRVLARNGCRVITPPDQKCCGAVHAHNGEREAAKKLARHNIDVFEKAGVEAIIVNSAGCGATMKEYGELLKNDPEYAEKAGAFSRKVRDFAEFLAHTELNRNLAPVKKRVTLQDPCHLAHAQRVKKEPRLLLKAIPGIELHEMTDSDRCCGSAGTYAFTQYDMSMKILDTKMKNIAATKAQAVIASNPPCLIQLMLGVKKTGLEMKVLHIAELLDQSYQLAEETQASSIMVQTE